MKTFRRLLALLSLAVLSGLPAAQAVTCTDATIQPSNPDSVYTVNGDGTVSDTRNGLVWKQCAEGQSGSACSGSATGHPWSAALGLAAASRFAGHSDWRLPNAKELLSLVEDCRIFPAINNHVFPNTPSSYFWSGSPVADFSDYAWGVYFNNGYVYDYRYDDGSVRLVRGGQSFGSFDRLSAAPPVVNTPPTIGNATFGSTGRQIGGSFNVADAEGDSIKNISLILRGGNGFNCSTGYLKPFNQAVNTGLINIVTTDCVQNLPVGAVTWELVLYDTRGAKAVSATGLLAREGNTTVPVGSRVQWTDSIATFEMGTAQTLRLAMRDAAGNLLSGFNGVGALTVTGLDVEMDGKRLVWFENGVASISGFTVLTGGSGTIEVTVPVQFAAADAASRNAAATSTTGAGSTLTASRQISASPSLCLGTTYGVRLVWENGVDVGDGELQVQKDGQSDWIAYPKSATVVMLRRTPIFQGELYRLRFKPVGAVAWANAGRIYRVDRSCKPYSFITQTLLSTAVKRPIILIHGILGSTLQNDRSSTLYPVMPKEICSTLDQCQGLSFWSIAFDTLGWKGLQTKLEEMGYKVYLAPWDWRQGSLDRAAQGFLLPVIEQALKDSPGHQRVDVIAHSMGGLVTRDLIQRLNKGNLIERFVMVGTPNGGSVNAYYLMSAADPLRLDRSLDYSWGKPDVYTNTANNLFLGTGRKALVKTGADDAESQEGAGITGYTAPYAQIGNRRKAIQQLVPGGLNLLPLASNQFFLLHKGDGSISLPTVQDSTYLTRLYEKGSTHLVCNTSPSDRRANDSDPSAYTWLLLSNSEKTLTKAHVATSKPDAQFMDDYIAMGKPGDSGKVYASITEKAGDGTVPFEWAKSGLDSLVSGGCVIPFAEGGSHAMMPANADIQTEIFRILKDNRVDLSLPSKASPRALADAPSLSLGVTGPFRGLLEGASGKFGDDGSSADLQASLPGGSYQTLDNLTSFGVSPYSAGTYTVSLQSVAGFVGRWVPFELSSTVAGSSRSIKGGFIKSAGVEQIRFTVDNQGRLQLIDRPRMPLNPTVSFLNNQQQTLISWDAPTDPGITGYRVYAREEERLNFSVMATLGRSENRYTYSGGAVSSASVTQAMEFVITALDAQGRESLASEIVSNAMLDGIDPISFADQYTAQTNTWVQSAPVSITGNNVPVSITIAGGEYSIGGGAFTSVGGSVEAGQQVVVRVLTPANQGQSSTASLTLGSESVYFTVTVGSTPPLLGAALISETIPAGTSIATGQSFTKSWVIKNTGSTTWGSTARLKWLSGDNLSNHSDVPVVGSVATGDIATFSVAMTGSAAPGSYREDWRLLDGSGEIIPVSGSNTVAVSIVVASNATVPGAPTLNSIDIGPGRATLHFAAPTNNGGAPITGYTATCTASGQPTRTATGTGSPLTVRNLAAGVIYQCSLTATNGGGLTSVASVPIPVTPTPGKSSIVPILMLLLD